jgi:hypothetical protein
MARPTVGWTSRWCGLAWIDKTSEGHQQQYLAPLVLLETNLRAEQLTVVQGYFSAALTSTGVI